MKKLFDLVRSRQNHFVYKSYHRWWQSNKANVQQVPITFFLPQHYLQLPFPPTKLNYTPSNKHDYYTTSIMCYTWFKYMCYNASDCRRRALISKSIEGIMIVSHQTGEKTCGSTQTIRSNPVFILKEIWQFWIFQLRIQYFW